MYISLTISRKLHRFYPRYNLKQKYITLIPNYNLERENYKDKSNLLTLDLSSKAKLEDWEGVKHPTCLMKPVF